MASAPSIPLVIPEEVIESIAERVADKLSDRPAGASPGRWMSVEQASAYTGLSRDAIYKLTSRKAIPHSKIGSRLLFDLLALDRWLEDHAEGPTKHRPQPLRKVA